LPLPIAETFTFHWKIKVPTHWFSLYTLTCFSLML